MLFNSWPFVALVVGTLVVYYLPPLQRWQTHLLILASFIFYAYNHALLLLLLLASIAINVVTSYLVVTGRKERQRFWAVTGVVLNLSVLLFFKYSPLFGRTLFSDISDPDSIGHFLTTIPLPIGISFFTFQGISLVVEVFRHHKGGETPTGERAGIAAGIVSLSFREHWRRTALFKAFFPQLVAGPIVKAHEFYPQIEPKRLRDVKWETAFRALATGYFLKMVIADNLKDSTFYLEYPYFLTETTPTLAALLFGYSMQIFADFAGYSLIAIGLGYLFGYKLPTNFNFPYLARSFSEFWRRWHISLSTWLREYLYIPLGGNRRGPVRTYVNLFVVMFLGGLWHGAAWSYAVWGTFHGVALAGERFVKQRIRLPKHWIIDAARMLAVFGFVTFAWLLFKLPKFEHVIAYVRALGQNMGPPNAAMIAPILTFSLPVLLYYCWHVMKRRAWGARLAQLEFLVLGALLAGIALNSGSPGAFIYFQF